MTRSAFIAEAKNQVENLKAEQQEMKQALKKTYNSETYSKYSKLGYEISALENAIRELERK